MIRKKRIGGGSHSGGQTSPRGLQFYHRGPGANTPRSSLRLPHRPPEPFRSSVNQQSGKGC